MKLKKMIGASLIIASILIPQSTFATHTNEIEKIENRLFIWDDDIFVELKKGTKKYEETLKNVKKSTKNLITSNLENIRIDDILKDVENLLENI